jgi:hypothetical protein
MTDGLCFESPAFVPYLRSDAGQAAIFQYCVDACNSANAGAGLQCIAQNFPGDACSMLQDELLRDGGNLFSLGDAVLAQCDSSAGSDAGSVSCGDQCMACEGNCSQARQQCDMACLDAGSGDVCLNCNYNCNQELDRCSKACPSN